MIVVGKTAAVSTMVDEFNTARVICSGNLEVFATPMMIALMERAACAALADALEPGQTSVGTKINVSHTSASPVGSRITAAATITSVDGRMVEFDVTAGDEAKEIGNGTHTRAIVNEAKFMAKVNGPAT